MPALGSEVAEQDLAFAAHTRSSRLAARPASSPAAAMLIEVSMIGIPTVLSSLPATCHDERLCASSRESSAILSYGPARCPAGN